MDKQPTQEQIAESQKVQMEQIETERKRILKDFEEIKKELVDKGYDEQSYKTGSSVSVDSTIIVKMSALIQGIQSRLEKVNEAITTAHKYANDMLGLGALELLDMHNDMARIHILACEEGNTVSHKELDAEDAKVKVQEKKIITPDSKIIV